MSKLAALTYKLLGQSPIPLLGATSLGKATFHPDWLCETCPSRRVTQPAVWSATASPMAVFRYSCDNGMEHCQKRFGCKAGRLSLPTHKLFANLPVTPNRQYLYAVASCTDTAKLLVCMLDIQCLQQLKVSCSSTLAVPVSVQTALLLCLSHTCACRS